MKVFVSKDAYRMDGMPGFNRQRMPDVDITIFGYKKQNRQYIYNHTKKLFFESGMDEESMLRDLKAYSNVDSEKVLGKENVCGYKCEKKEVITTHNMMGMKTTNRIIVWQSDQFEMPLRTRTQNGHTTELRNINTDKQPGKIFQRPTGYKKVNNMMEVMGMDIRSMTNRKKRQRNKNQKPTSNKTTDINMETFPADFQKAVGENADPKQIKQMKQAMDQAKKTNMNQGAASGLWNFIAKRVGDEVGSEIKTPHAYNVTLGTQASLKAFCSYYENQLKPKGWRVGGKHIQNGQGFSSLLKGDQQLMISSADDPGMKGHYKLFYNLQLTGPDIE